MTNLNKEIIKKNFSRSSSDYENEARVQKNSAQKLVSLTKNFIEEKSKILDLGSGTGFVAREILKISPNAKITETDLSSEMLAKWQRPDNVSALICDIENLPFLKEKFDIIFSSFALHWINDFEKSFRSFSNLLTGNGIFAICLPCAPSLGELDVFTINKFPIISEITTLLEKNNLQKIHFEKEIFTEQFFDEISAVKYIKKIGGNYNANQKSSAKSWHKLEIFI